MEENIELIKAQMDENLESMNNGMIYDYTKQMAENHAFKVDENFWMVVKQKPKWMPSWLYKMVIKNLVEFQQHN
jgi:hypothetical protein